MMKRRHLNIVAIVGFAVLLCRPSAALAQTAPALGSAESFAVLASSTVTNTGSSIVTGDLGVSPGTAITGFPPGSVVGGTHAADATAGAAQSSVTTAYNNLTGQACTQDLTSQDLGGLTLIPGVYCYNTSAQLTGPLTLDAQGDANAVFIFKIGSTLTTASGSSVTVTNGGTSCNVFWQVGTSATIGSTTSFEGNILAQASISLNSGATVLGRALARTGAVTLISNDVDVSLCTAVIPCPTITLSPATLPDGQVGIAYTETFMGSGGTAPYSFSVTTGSLPAGLALTSAGVLSGTPTAAGTSTFTVRVTDANGCYTELPYSIVIAAAPPPPPTCPTITLSPATLPSSQQYIAYSQTFTGGGGTAPYYFGVTAGSLPAGLTLTSGGLLSGTPTTNGSSTFTVRVTDANGCYTELPYTMVIAAAPPPPPTCPTITLSPATLPNGTRNIAYTQTFTGGGGTAPYYFGVTAGSLPAGLTLTSGGVLSGTPTTSGASTFTVRVTDSNGCYTELPYTMTVANAVPTMSQWLIVFLAAGLLGIGYLRLRRRQTTG